MPPRLAVLAIVAFWLAATGWMISREVLPEWQASQGHPPPIVVEVPHEIGSDYTGWQVFLDGELAGTGRSEVRRQPDRTFVFFSELTFNRPKLLNLISRIRCSYRVDEDRKLLGMSFQVRVPNQSFLALSKAGQLPPPKRKTEPSPRNPDGDSDDAGGPDEAYQQFGLDAKVEDGKLYPTVQFGAESWAAFKLSPLQLPEKSAVFNPVQVGGKMTGLFEGQTWRIPLMDPIAAALPIKNIFTSDLIAVVSEEDLPWAGQPVPCFLVEFRKRPGEEPIAKSWVRRRDGVILQQLLQDKTLKIDLKLIRSP